MKKAAKRHRKENVQSKNWYPSHKFFCPLCPVTQSFLLGFSWSSDSITASNKKCTSKKEPTSVSEITIQYLHKNIKIPLLCQCGLFINAEVSKNSIGLKMWFSTSVDITWYAEAVIYAKNLFPSHSIVSQWSFSMTQGKWQSKIATMLNEVKNAILQVTYFFEWSYV